MREIEARKDAIYHPISNEHPCGEDLSFSPEFDRIQEARREDDQTADYGEWTAALKQADWNVVEKSCAELLATRSKDLRLAAWLTEALVKLDGLAGLVHGIEVFSGLVRTFGNRLYPHTEDGDDEQRLGTLAWFVQRLSQVVRFVPLSKSSSGNFTLPDFEAARSLQAQLQKDPERDAAIGAKLTIDKIAALIAETDKNFYLQSLIHAERAEALLAKLAEELESEFGGGCPSFAPLSSTVNAVHHQLLVIAEDRGLRACADPVEASKSAPAVDYSVIAEIAIEGEMKTRAQALGTLKQVAAFFRRTEPHSPVAYLADKAVQWGEMPLHVWLQSVVKDQGTLGQLEEMLGWSADDKRQ
ncbi:type VI secretion system protein TssA [Noviherbaspirillum saxi]|nr:type VI secretion system protein TssA [Noviherbaspirillum saxi]